MLCTKAKRKLPKQTNLLIACLSLSLSLYITVSPKSYKVQRSNQLAKKQGSPYFPLKHHPHQGILPFHGPKRVMFKTTKKMEIQESAPVKWFFWLRLGSRTCGRAPNARHALASAPQSSASACSSRAGNPATSSKLQWQQPAFTASDTSPEMSSACADVKLPGWSCYADSI